MAEQKTDRDRATEFVSVYLFLEGDLPIVAPAHAVWPHMLNYPSWQNFSLVEHVSGEPGGVGEVMRLKKEEGDAPTTPYFARTIKLEPGQRVVWKTFRSEPGTFGIVDFSVVPDGANSLFRYRSIYEHQIPAARDVEAFRRENEGLLEKLSADVFKKLKHRVEQGAAS